MKRTVTVVVIASMFPAGAVAASGGVYRGHTSQNCVAMGGCAVGKPIPFRFTVSKGYVTSLRFGDHSTPAGCFVARVHTLGNLRLKISDGKFSFHGPGHGAPPGVKIVITGKITATHAKGTIVDRFAGCTSGKVTWTASQP